MLSIVQDKTISDIKCNHWEIQHYKNYGLQGVTDCLTSGTVSKKLLWGLNDQYENRFYGM